MKLRIGMIAAAVGAATLVIGQVAQPPSGPTAASPTSGLALIQKLDSPVPLNVPFKDESGKDVILADYFGKKPVVLMLVFYGCAGICASEFESMASTLRAFKKEKVGRDFDIVTVSIHPKETPQLAAATKKGFVDRLVRYQPDIAQGWHFLTGPYESARQVANAVGFQYVWDPVKEVVRHPAGIMVLTPSGHVSRYFYGVEFPAKPLSDAISEAATNQIGPKAEEILLGCIMYDPNSGKYTMNIRRALTLSAGLTVFVLLTSMLVMSINNRRRAQRGTQERGDPK